MASEEEYSEGENDYQPEESYGEEEVDRPSKKRRTGGGGARNTRYSTVGHFFLYFAQLQTSSKPQHDD